MRASFGVVAVVRLRVIRDARGANHRFRRFPRNTPTAMGSRESAKGLIRAFPGFSVTDVFSVEQNSQVVIRPFLGWVQWEGGRFPNTRECSCSGNYLGSVLLKVGPWSLDGQGSQGPRLARVPARPSHKHEPHPTSLVNPRTDQGKRWLANSLQLRCSSRTPAANPRNVGSPSRPSEEATTAQPGLPIPLSLSLFLSRTGTQGRRRRRPTFFFSSQQRPSQFLVLTKHHRPTNRVERASESQKQSYPPSPNKRTENKMVNRILFWTGFGRPPNPPHKPPPPSQLIDPSKND